MAFCSSLKSCSVIGVRPRIIYNGKMKKSYVQGEEYAAFLNIPYAARPDKKKACQAPQDLPPAQEPRPGHSLPVYDATKKGKISTQLLPPNYEGSSDCLYLNIFVPQNPEEMNAFLPVLVFIHGGGFTIGSNDPKEYIPDFIVRHGVIFVTIKYRLGVHGFLNTQSEDCPGNTGLKDQVKALEWVRDNIISFKGNPQNVTLSGWSAGATCVNLHLISEKSKGLFHKAIVHSGGIYCPWGYRGHQYEQNRMLLDDSKFKKYLHKKESKALQRRADKLLHLDRLERHPKSYCPFFGPTLEKFTEEGFITEDVEEMMKKVHLKIPLMIGIAKAEGISALTLDDSETIFLEWLESDRSFCQVLMDNFRWSVETAEKFVHVIRNKYFPNWTYMNRAQIDRRLQKFIGDMDFRRFYDNFKFGPEKTLPENLYVYRFDHVSMLSTVRRLRMVHLDDATHGDDVDYLYPRKLMTRYIREEPEIELVINHLCSLWANFCRTGVPKSDFDKSNTVWRPHTEEKPCFLSISKNLRLMETSLFKKEWDWLNAIVNPQPTVESPAVTPE